MVRAWDPVVRVLHWSIAALVAIDLLNEAGANPWHRWIGYAAGMLVAARLLWGVVGSPAARLAAMIRSAARLKGYLASLSRREDRSLPAGHTPAGACMALLLWSLILFVVATGWMTQLDAYWGDETLHAWHAVSSYALAAFAVLHVAGVLVMSGIYRTNIMKSMLAGADVPGRRRAGEGS